ncbi:DNA-binding protein RFX2-like [Paramacrobiotus metropolitanus]|uniref:DNA-binding protein RFX2-like n=1 Tax=Paramacrobiotus metropolitanus TaxID=2943436 RepID=UPI002445929C|nr:DNA-binding protein RFX2-like [Paramacrobiotus metropolitanus]
MSQKGDHTYADSLPNKRPRLITVRQRSASMISEDNVDMLDESAVIDTLNDLHMHDQNEDTFLTADTDPCEEQKDSDIVDRDDADYVPSKPTFYLRRQPKRFVHARPFTNGLSDNATAEWLKEHFHAKSGSLIPKSFLCDRYEEFCTRTKRKPMNNATLGRFIRGVFPKLETRRLGARQQSRYFYNNLAIRNSSPYAAMIRQEMQSVNIRRNRIQSTQNAQSRSASPAADAQLDTDCASVPIVFKIPPYLPGFTQRRLAYTSYSAVRENGEPRLEEALKRFDDEGCAHVLATMEHNKEKHRSMIHPALLDSVMFSARFPAAVGVLPNCVTEVQVSRFLVGLRAHIGILSSVFLGYNMTAIPHILENFWLNKKRSVQVFDTVTFAPLIWPPLQTFITQVYRHLYESIMDLFIADYLVPLDEHVWGILFVVASKYYQCMEYVTRGLPNELRGMLVNGAQSFAQYLRDLLNANHDACYISLTCMDKNVVTLLTGALNNLMRSELLDCLLWLQRFALSDLLTALQTFVSFSEIKRDAVTAWANWIKGLVSSYVDRYATTDDKLTTLRLMAGDWCLFMTAAEDAMTGFHGDLHIKAGFFAMCVSMFCMVVLSVMKDISAGTSLDIYSKFARPVVSDNTEDFSASMDYSWWPDFPTISSMPIAEDILQSETYVRTFPALAGVAYDISEAQLMEGVRTSHRAGKGRNRWLAEGEWE